MFAVQFVQLVPAVAAVQPDPFAEQYTAATATLSLALPVTVNVPLVHCWFAVGLTMLTVGLVVSTKLARNTRFVAIVNRSVVPFVSTFAEPSVQLVNPNPVAAAAVSV